MAMRLPQSSGRRWVPSAVLVFALCAVLGVAGALVFAQEQPQEISQELSQEHRAIADLHNAGEAGIVAGSPQQIDPNLPPEVQERIKRQREREEKHRQFLKEHEGHDKMHMEMFLLLVGTLILAQVVLTFWRRYHFNSYQLVTLVGMYLFPIYFAITNKIIFLIVSWVAFTGITAYVTYIATRKHIAVKTPKIVYGYFFFVIKATSIISLVGYVVAILDILVGPYLPQPANVTLMTAGFGGMIYGLYYGVLSRDFADICARRMATSIGYYSASGFPQKNLTSGTCAICGEKPSPSERKIQLDCGHTFHDFCIRGWCIVGKKQTCPYCKEKVDLARKFPSPWAKTDVLYAQILDVLRYFVVWYPVIIYLVQGEYWIFGLK